MERFTREQPSPVEGQEYILAANFRSGKIDVFDSNFKPVNIPERIWYDDDIPPGFAPFNVQGIGKNIYVTFAQQDSAKHDPSEAQAWVLSWSSMVMAEALRILSMVTGSMRHGVSCWLPQTSVSLAMPSWWAISAAEPLRHSIR